MSVALWYRLGVVMMRRQELIMSDGGCGGPERLGVFTLKAFFFPRSEVGPLEAFRRLGIHETELMAQERLL